MKNYGIVLVRIALILLLLGLFFGHLASETYRMNEAKDGVLGFLSLRPLHVSSAYLGIITGGLGLLSLALQKKRQTPFGTRLQQLHLFLCLSAS